jgi:hypothetical protein
MLKGPSLAVAAALLAAPLMGSAAWGQAPCVSAPVGVYTMAGFSCTVDGLLFSNFFVNVTTDQSGVGSVTLGNITPFNPPGLGEFGLSLNYTAVAPVAGAAADIAWEYVVSTLPGTPAIIDAFLALAGNTSGAGVAAVSEILTNGVTLSLNAPGSTTATFSPVNVLGVMKDQINFVGPEGGFSTASIVTNAFSLVPAPIVGAGVPGLVIACGGLLVLARRRRRQQIA